MVSENFDPYHKWLGIPAGGKRPPTHYQLLGIGEKEADRSVIEAAASRQAAYVATFRDGEHGPLADRVLYQINDAKFTLLDPEGRKRYDAALGSKRKGRRGTAGREGLPPRRGGRSVGEEPGVARELGKVMAVIVAGFLLMLAAASVYWTRNPDGRDAAAIAPDGAGLPVIPAVAGPPAEPPADPANEPPPSPAVPDDAETFGSSGYKAFTDRLSWPQAKRRCEELGGRLPVVSSGEQNRFLTDLTRRAGLEAAWLGATDERTEGTWVGVDGKSLDYANWGRKQPNNKGDGEHYVVLLANDGTWSDQPAESVQHVAGFVCEWPAADGKAGPASGDGFVDLFNGRDLTGWTAPGDAWRVEDGLLVGDGKRGQYLLSDREYADFEFEYEFKLSPRSDAAVVLRVPANPAGTEADGIAIQIVDEDLVRKPVEPASRLYVTGAVFGALPAEPGVVRKAGQWNRMTVRAIGRRVSVTLNGRTVLDRSLDEVSDPAKYPGHRRMAGRIGLLNGNGRIEFRGLRLRPIDASAKATEA